MGTRERRQRGRADLRTRIMDAARTLFAAEGYAAVSMRRIADAVEYSPTALYLHFRDKRTLIRELCSDDFRRFSAASADLAHVADPVDRLRRLGRFYVRFAVDHPNHYKLMFLTEPPLADEPADGAGPYSADDLADRGNPDRDGYAYLLQAVADAIAAGRLRPGLADVGLAAQTIWAAVHGVAALEIVMGRDPWVDWAPLADRTAAAVDGILDGLLAPPGSSPSPASSRSASAPPPPPTRPPGKRPPSDPAVNKSAAAESHPAGSPSPAAPSSPRPRKGR